MKLIIKKGLWLGNEGHGGLSHSVDKYLFECHQALGDSKEQSALWRSAPVSVAVHLVTLSPLPVIG